jgi:tetratricopeptide (TPR) repeat protein
MELAAMPESPFVGRESEWRQLNEAWKSAQQGGAHLVLVTGEPGIGKSRLAQELGRSVRASGYPVASARAYEAAGRLPWGPVVDMLRSDALYSRLGQLESVWKAELARLMPELSDTAYGPRASQSGDPAQRHRLFDAVRRAIGALDRPLLLIIDDLQWCDAETIELIGFVVSSGRQLPVLIVGTVRAEELPQKHSLHVLIDALDRDRSVTQLQLERFDRDITVMLAARLGVSDTLDPDMTERLWKETEGNPLFVIEAIRAGIASNADLAGLTPTIRALLKTRLERLTDGARRLAEVAAVYGRPFTARLMVTATGITDSTLVDRLDELWRRRIIREDGPRYDFSHDKLRAVALEMVSPARLRILHRVIAEAIAVDSGDEPGAASAQLAAHYDQAGMVESAIRAYWLAGERAVAVSALEEAVSLFQRALTLIADLPGSSDRDRQELDIRLALGSPLVALEGYGSKSSHKLYERARSLCRRLHCPVHPSILRGLGLARLQGCRFDDCEELAWALLDHESRDPVTRTEGRYLLGVSAFWRGDLAEARHYLNAAIDSYDESHGDEHLALYAQNPKAVCLVRLAWAELWVGNAGEAAHVARSALDYAVDIDHLMTQAYVITYAAIAAAESEDFEGLTELLGDAERLWERLSDRYLVVVLDALRGWMDVRNGSAAGIDQILDSVTRSRTEGETLHLTYTLLLLARARGLVGEFHEGRAATQEGLVRTLGSKQCYLEPELLRLDGELAYRAGDAEAAAASLEGAVEVARNQGAGLLEQRACQSLKSRFPD